MASEGFTENTPQTSESSNQQEEKELFLPGREFFYRLNEQLFRLTQVQLEGYTEPVDAAEAREDASQFIAGIEKLLSRAQLEYDNYWSNLISATGNQTYRSNFYGTPFYTEEQKKIFKDYRKNKELGEYERGMHREMIETLNLAFDLYACISILKPNTIITLTNGALRLHSLCKAMGFDSDNFLSIHKELPREYNYRKNLEEPLYDGKPIEEGSKILILEDTSSLGSQSTYGLAREWLKEQGVTDFPVFIEQIYQTIQRAGQRWDKVGEEHIKIQKYLNENNCYNSYARIEANDDLYKNVQTNLSSLIREHLEVYDRFFDFIRSMGRSFNE